MSCQNTQDFCVGMGETFQPILRWGSEVFISKPITAITQAAPAVVTAVGHGVPDGWRVAVVSAKGMTQINALNFPPLGADWEKATLLTVDTVQLNRLNSADYAAYTSGGFLVYNTPVTLAGMTGIFTIRDAPLTGNVLATLTSTPAAGLTLNDTTKQILPVLATVTGAVAAGAFIVGNTYQITAVGTTDFTLIGASANTVGALFTATGAGTGTGTAAARLLWSVGYYDLELTSAAGTVVQLLTGTITIN